MGTCTIGNSEIFENKNHPTGIRNICAPKFVRVWRVGDSYGKGVGIVVTVEAGSPHDDKLEASGAEGEGQSSMVAFLVSSHKECFRVSWHHILLEI